MNVVTAALSSNADLRNRQSLWPEKTINNVTSGLSGTRWSFITTILISRGFLTSLNAINAINSLFLCFHF